MYIITGPSPSMFKRLYRSSDDVLFPVSTVYGWFAKTAGKVCAYICFILSFCLGYIKQVLLFSNLKWKV
jgi:hypothetical protein